MALLNTNIGPERVQVFDQPLGTVQVPGASISSAAFLIGTSKVGAPENSPTEIRSLDEFVDTFGDVDDMAIADQYYAVKGFYDNVGTGALAIIVNCGSSPSSSDYIGDAAAGTGLRALDSVDSLGMVCVPGLPLEIAYLVHSSLIDYTETVRADFGSTLSTSFSLASIPKEIGSANVDETVTTTKFISVAGTGPWVLSVEDVVAGGTADLSEITPGMIVEDTGGTFTAVISAVDDTLDTITILTDPASTWSAGDDVIVKIPSAVTYKETVINNPSRVMAWYFNYASVLDEAAAASPGDVTTTDLIGHVAGIIARIDANNAIGGHSHAPAGLQYAGIAGIQGLALSISERLHAEDLRTNFINRITSFAGSGNVIFGGYTADSGTSAIYTADEQLIQVMRALQYIKASLEPGLVRFLWENFSPRTQGQITQAIYSFLRSNIHLFPVGLPESSQFQVVEVTPTQDELDIGLLRCRVLVRTNKAVRFIEVSLEFPLPEA